MLPEYAAILERSRERADFVAKQMRYLSKFNVKNFDHIVAGFHDEVFAGIDCLACANCCRSHGPKMSEPEIRRACKAAGFEPKRFQAELLKRDEELGWMFDKPPCAFLGEDGACSIYDDRPRDCDSFPYTRERAMQRTLGRLAFVSTYCPAAFLIAQKVIERFAPGTDK